MLKIPYLNPPAKFECDCILAHFRLLQAQFLRLQKYANYNALLYGHSNINVIGGVSFGYDSVSFDAG